jgi:predicted neuraminidase
MAQKKYLVKLEGKSQLHEPVIKLEDIKVNIWSLDGGITWENKNISIEVLEKLEIYMSCKAMSGTEWKFSIMDKSINKNVYETEGKTGEKLESQNGHRIPNFSERKTSI